MSIAAEADKKAAHTRGATPAPTAREQGVAPPPRLRRRPMLVVASVAAVCLGSLLSVWAYTSTSSTREVVAVRSSVHRGEVIPREALMTVRVGVDPALQPVPAEAVGRVAGQRAAMDLSAGGLVTEEAVASTVVPARDMSVVGVSLPAGLMPGEPLRSGDRVRVVATPGEQGDVTAGGQRFIAATVVGTYPDAESGRTVVSVQVPYPSAAELAARAATGRVVLVLDSRER